MTLPDRMKHDLLQYLKGHRKTNLITIYLLFLEKKFHMNPVLFPMEKKIYQSLDDLIQHLEKENKLWRETEICIQYGQQSVNEETKKIYICPFTGKVFGDNTHPNPQDAIYDWVSSCPENTESVDGMKVKRFFVSEDPEVIKNYIKPRKDAIKKVVFSSAITGKLFNSKEAVIQDFKQNHIKHMTLFEVQNQNRYDLEEKFLQLLQDQINEEKITVFVQELSQHKEFTPYLDQWIE
ncbi:MAG: DUF2709 domain-containing protein [Parachlamydiales bacterium]|nr:DUF2709 domain-containing protein [Parachlamydiales bacterium]